MKATEQQVGGDHYKSLAIQPMEYSIKNGLDPLQHTAIKYITRHKLKNGKEDILKAIHTLELILEMQYPEYEAIEPMMCNESKTKFKKGDKVLWNFGGDEFESVVRNVLSNGNILIFRKLDGCSIEVDEKEITPML